MGAGSGGARGAPRNGTSTCRSLINHINHADLKTICDIMNSIEVCQLLHITLTIPVNAELTLSAMRRLKSFLRISTMPQTYFNVYIHKEKADLYAIPNEFISAN